MAPRWHLDEMACNMALQLLQRLLRNQHLEPESIVTDGLASICNAFDFQRHVTRRVQLSIATVEATQFPSARGGGCLLTLGSVSRTCARSREPMTESPSAACSPQPRSRSWVRAVVVVVICVSAALLLSVDVVYEGLQRVLTAAEPMIAGHPYLGPVVFVLLAAFSAILAFFSSALLVPAAVFTWGSTVTVLLLWLGWLLGGICTYALGRGLRRPQGKPSRTSSQFDFYRRRVSGQAPFVLVLLLYLALPSEIPGYLCGYLGVRFRTCITALAVAELPYAVGAVLLGDGVVNRHIGWLLAFGVLGAILSLYALRMLHRRLDQDPLSSPGSARRPASRWRRRNRNCST